jgi:PAS domain S-box-containing protein
LTFTGIASQAGYEHALPLAALPFQLWAAVRFGARGATGANALIAVAAVVVTLVGGAAAVGDMALTTQGILGLTTAMSLTVAAALHELRQTGARAAAAEDILRDAIQSLGEGVVLYDAEDRLVFCNDEFKKIHAKAADCLNPGRTFDELQRLAAERGCCVQPSSTNEEAFAARLAHHRDPTGQLELQTPEGRSLLVRERRMKNGGCVGIHTDITELKRQQEAMRASEERYRRLIEITPDAVLVMRDGRVALANEAFLRLVGADTASQVLGRSVLDFVDPESIDSARGRMAQLQEPGATVPLAERKLLRLDGTLVEAEGMACSFRDEQGLAILAIARDITARKAVELQLRQAQKMEAIGRLTGGVAHDFNNLLGVIIGNLEMLQARVGDDTKLRRPTDLAMAAADRGAELTQRLLAFSRRQRLELRPIDLNALVVGMQDLLQPLLGEDIEIETILRPDLWPVVGDAGQIETCLVNLAINARDAMPAGGLLTIETGNCRLGKLVAARQLDVPPGEYVILSVTDAGTGMPAHVMEHAFEPFFTTKDNGRGSGLGLSMVYGFVRQLGGDVAIASEVGRGTTVRLYLPRAQPAASTETSLVETAVEGGGEPRGHETILVVEDDAALLEVVVCQLAEYGYRILSAVDGPSAMQIVNSDVTIDLLLTDVLMPNGMTGAQLAERAQQRRADLRVLFTSGYPRGVMHANGQLKFGVPLLRKPYKQIDLARAVRRQLDRPIAGGASATG